MNLPDIETVNSWLKMGYKSNPGSWVRHSELVGLAAKLIAEKTAYLDPNKAHIMGLIHDIGRWVGVTQSRHCIDGYRFLKEKNYEKLARICITHCFPTKDLHANVSQWDCDETELTFVENFLEQTDMDDYDRLIQLCDCIADPNGFVLMEKRLVDIVIRYGLKNQSGINLTILEKWQKLREIKDYFDQKVGCSIYSLLPDVIENTFS